MCIDFYYNNKKEGRFNANLNKNLRDSLHWSKSRRLDKSINLLNKTLLGLVIIARLKSHTPKNSRLRIAATQNSALHIEMRNKKPALLPKLNTHFCMEFYTVFFIILQNYRYKTQIIFTFVLFASDRFNSQFDFFNALGVWKWNLSSVK